MLATLPNPPEKGSSLSAQVEPEGLRAVLASSSVSTLLSTIFTRKDPLLRYHPLVWNSLINSLASNVPRDTYVDSGIVYPAVGQAVTYVLSDSSCPYGVSPIQNAYRLLSILHSPMYELHYSTTEMRITSLLEVLVTLGTKYYSSLQKTSSEVAFAYCQLVTLVTQIRSTVAAMSGIPTRVADWLTQRSVCVPLLHLRGLLRASHSSLSTPPVSTSLSRSLGFQTATHSDSSTPSIHSTTTAGLPSSLTSPSDLDHAALSLSESLTSLIISTLFHPEFVAWTGEDIERSIRALAAKRSSRTGGDGDSDGSDSQIERVFEEWAHEAPTLIATAPSDRMLVKYWDDSKDETTQADNEDGNNNNATTASTSSGANKGGKSTSSSTKSESQVMKEIASMCRVRCISRSPLIGFMQQVQIWIAEQLYPDQILPYTDKPTNSASTPSSSSSTASSSSSSALTPSLWCPLEYILDIFPILALHFSRVYRQVRALSLVKARRSSTNPSFSDKDGKQSTSSSSSSSSVNPVGEDGQTMSRRQVLALEDLVHQRAYTAITSMVEYAYLVLIHGLTAHPTKTLNALTAIRQIDQSKRSKLTEPLPSSFNLPPLSHRLDSLHRTELFILYGLSGTHSLSEFASMGISLPSSSSPSSTRQITSPLASYQPFLGLSSTSSNPSSSSTTLSLAATSLSPTTLSSVYNPSFFTDSIAARSSLLPCGPIYSPTTDRDGSQAGYLLHCFESVLRLQLPSAFTSGPPSSSSSPSSLPTSSSSASDATIAYALALAEAVTLLAPEIVSKRLKDLLLHMMQISALPSLTAASPLPSPSPSSPSSSSSTYPLTAKAVLKLARQLVLVFAKMRQLPALFEAIADAASSALSPSHHRLLPWASCSPELGVILRALPATSTCEVWIHVLRLYAIASAQFTVISSASSASFIAEANMSSASSLLSLVLSFMTIDSSRVITHFKPLAEVTTTLLDAATRLARLATKGDHLDNASHKQDLTSMTNEVDTSSKKDKKDKKDKKEKKDKKDKAEKRQTGDGDSSSSSSSCQTHCILPGSLDSLSLLTKPVQLRTSGKDETTIMTERESVYTQCHAAVDVSHHFAFSSPLPLQYTLPVLVALHKLASSIATHTHHTPAAYPLVLVPLNRLQSTPSSLHSLLEQEKAHSMRLRNKLNESNKNETGAGSVVDGFEEGKTDHSHQEVSHLSSSTASTSSTAAMSYIDMQLLISSRHLTHPFAPVLDLPLPGLLGRVWPTLKQALSSPSHPSVCIDATTYTASLSPHDDSLVTMKAPKKRRVDDSETADSTTSTINSPSQPDRKGCVVSAPLLTYVLLQSVLSRLHYLSTYAPYSMHPPKPSSSTSSSSTTNKKASTAMNDGDSLGEGKGIQNGQVGSHSSLDSMLSYDSPVWYQRIDTATFPSGSPSSLSSTDIIPPQDAESTHGLVYSERRLLLRWLSELISVVTRHPRPLPSTHENKTGVNHSADDEITLVVGKKRKRDRTEGLADQSVSSILVDKNDNNDEEDASLSQTLAHLVEGASWSHSVLPLSLPELRVAVFAQLLTEVSTLQLNKPDALFPTYTKQHQHLQVTNKLDKTRLNDSHPTVTDHLIDVDTRDYHSIKSLIFTLMQVATLTPPPKPAYSVSPVTPESPLHADDLLRACIEASPPACLHTLSSVARALQSCSIFLDLTGGTYIPQLLLSAAHTFTNAFTPLLTSSSSKTLFDALTSLSLSSISSHKGSPVSLTPQSAHDAITSFSSLLARLSSVHPAQLAVSLQGSSTSSTPLLPLLLTLDLFVSELIQLPSTSASSNPSTLPLPSPLLHEAFWELRYQLSIMIMTLLRADPALAAIQLVDCYPIHKSVSSSSLSSLVSHYTSPKHVASALVLASSSSSSSPSSTSLPRDSLRVHASRVAEASLSVARLYVRPLLTGVFNTLSVSDARSTLASLVSTLDNKEVRELTLLLVNDDKRIASDTVAAAISIDRACRIAKPCLQILSSLYTTSSTTKKTTAKANQANPHQAEAAGLLLRSMLDGLILPPRWRALLRSKSSSLNQNSDQVNESKSVNGDENDDVDDDDDDDDNDGGMDRNHAHEKAKSSAIASGTVLSGLLSEITTVLHHHTKTYASTLLSSSPSSTHVGTGGILSSDQANVVALSLASSLLRAEPMINLTLPVSSQLAQTRSLSTDAYAHSIAIALVTVKQHAISPMPTDRPLHLALAFLQELAKVQAYVSSSTSSSSFSLLASVLTSGQILKHCHDSSLVLAVHALTRHAESEKMTNSADHTTHSFSEGHEGDDESMSLATMDNTNPSPTPSPPTPLNDSFSSPMSLSLILLGLRIVIATSPTLSPQSWLSTRLRGCLAQCISSLPSSDLTIFTRLLASLITPSFSLSLDGSPLGHIATANVSSTLNGVSRVCVALETYRDALDVSKVVYPMIGHVTLSRSLFALATAATELSTLAYSIQPGDLLSTHIHHPTTTTTSSSSTSVIRESADAVTLIGSVSSSIRAIATAHGGHSLTSLASPEHLDPTRLIDLSSLTSDPTASMLSSSSSIILAPSLWPIYGLTAIAGAITVIFARLPRPSPSITLQLIEALQPLQALLAAAACAPATLRDAVGLHIAAWTLCTPTCDALWSGCRNSEMFNSVGTAFIIRLARALFAFTLHGTATQRLRASSSLSSSSSSMTYQSHSSTTSSVGNQLISSHDLIISTTPLASSPSSATPTIQIRQFSAPPIAVDPLLFALSRVLLQIGNRTRTKYYSKVGQYIVSDYINATKLTATPLTIPQWRLLRQGIFAVMDVCGSEEIATVHASQDEAGRVALKGLNEERARFKYQGW